MGALQCRPCFLQPLADGLLYLFGPVFPCRAFPLDPCPPAAVQAQRQRRATYSSSSMVPAMQL